MPAILIIDDQPLNREYLVTLLNYFEHHVSEACNGNEALEVLTTGRFDLVIADLLMPTMDGYAFLQRLRENSRFANTPVIFYSAAAYEPQLRAMAEAHGVRHFLSKPAEPEVMLAAVNSALGKASATVSSKSIDRFNGRLLSAPADPIDPNAVVFVVEDDDVQRHFLAALITDASCNVRAFASAGEFLESYDASLTACLVLDLRLPGIRGLELLEILRSRAIHIPVIILTGHGDTASVVEAMRLDAMDFLEKPADRNILLTSVYRALQKDSIRRRVTANTEAIRIRMDSLTDREKDVVKLLVLGRTSKEIASELHISVKTVAHHRSHLMAKTQACNSADLVRISLAIIQQ